MRRGPRRHLGRAALLCVILAAGAALAACGGSGSASGNSTQPTSSTEVTPPAGTGSTGSGGSGGGSGGGGSTGGTGGTGGTPTTAPASGTSSRLDLSKLGSLSDYTFTFRDNGLVITGAVHSPTDWRTDQPLVVLHIAGFTYGKLGPYWYKNKDNPASYEESAYPATVSGFEGFLSIAGARLTKGPPCRQAGLAGHTWTIKTPKAASGILSETASACVADKSGALLEASFGAKGSAVPGALKGIGYSFTVDSIGTVARIAVPSPVHSA